MSFWKLEEARLVQQVSSGSGINAESFTLGPGVPAGKVWVVLGMGYRPDVAETQTISIDKITAGGTAFAVLNPVSLLLYPAFATCIEQGMEYILFPGEYFTIRRASHTVGSSMGGYMQFIEIDLPLYTYEEPLIVKRQKSAISAIRQRLGGGTGRPPGSMSGAPGHGGGAPGGGPAPV